MIVIIFYIINYATKVKDLVLKRVAVVVKVFRFLDDLIIKRQAETTGSCGEGNGF